MKTMTQKTRVFLKSLWQGILGIYVEVLLTIVVISAGFVVCAFWWGVAR